MLPTADDLLNNIQTLPPSGPNPVGPDAPLPQEKTGELPTADDLYNKASTEAYEHTLVPTLGRFVQRVGEMQNEQLKNPDNPFQTKNLSAVEASGIPLAGPAFTAATIIHDAVMMPLTGALDMYYAGTEALPATHNDELRKTLQMLPEALPQGTMGMSVHLPEIAKMIDRSAPLEREALAAGAVRVSEDKYMGTEPMTPAEQQVADLAASKIAPEPPAPTIHDIARQVAPDTFAEYDNLKIQRETLGDMLKNAAEENRKTIEEQSPFKEQMDDIEEKMAGASKRSQKISQARLDDLQEQHDAWMSENLKPSEDMEQIRAAYNAADYRMRDLAPDVSDAYRKAQERIPIQETEAPAVTPEDKELAPPSTLQGKMDVLGKEAESAEGQAKDVLARAAEPKVDLKTVKDDVKWAQDNNRPDVKDTLVAKLEDMANKEAVAKNLPEGIAAHVTKELQKAGRPVEEADAAAKLIEAHYTARSERFGGLKGTPEEMYARDSAIIKAGRNVTAREFAQGKGRQLFQKGDYGLPGFYSKMYRALGEKLNATGTPKQMLDQVQSLVKNGAFKKDELYWSGLEDYLKNAPKDVKIGKDELMNWLDNNKLEVGEHIYDTESAPDYDGYSEDDFYRGDEGEPIDDPDLLDSETDYYADQFHDENTDPEKYFSENPDTSLVEEEEDDEGNKKYTWNEDAIREEAAESARSSLEENGDRETTAELGHYRWNIRYNDSTREWSISGEHDKSGTSRNPLDAANEAIWEYIRDNDLARYSDEIDNEAGGTKYSDYQEEGPKDDYQEMLITLPEIPDKNVSQHDWPQEAKDNHILMHMRFNTRVDKGGAKTLFMEEMQSDWQQQARKRGIIQTDKLAELNQARSDANFKVGEIEGRKFEWHGDTYELPESSENAPGWSNTSTLPERVRDLAERDTHGRELNEENQRFMEDVVAKSRKLSDDEARQHQKDLMQAVADRDDIANAAEKARSGVAAAPFNDLNKYTELGLKRIIGYASEKGFDKVAWTTGEQQATRWSGALQREVKQINVSPESTPEGIKLKVMRQGGGNVSDFIAKQVKDAHYDDATGYVTMKPEDVEHVFGKGIQDEIAKRAQELSEGPPKESPTDQEVYDAQTAVEDVIKKLKEADDENSTPVERALLENEKELAIHKRDQLIKAREKDSIIQGLDLKVSDKGMTEVYDRVMVNTANSIIKKFGLKVKPAELDLGDTDIAFDKEIPPLEDIRAKYDTLMKQKTDAGLTEDRDINDKWSSDDENNLRTLDKFFSVLKEQGDDAKVLQEAFHKENSFGSHMRDMFDIKAERQTKHSQQWSFDLSDDLKKSAAEGQTLFQGARGKIRLGTQTSRAAITLMKDADASTFIHETGHHWLEELMADARDPDAPQDLRDDAQTVRNWLGAEGDITTRQHEKFARGFERYMMEGIAPTQELGGVFAKFKNWLTQIYRTVQKLRSPISDDIRHVYDRLLSTKPQKTVVAPEDTAGKMLADIHEADARLAPPELKEVTADNIEHELDKNLYLHNPEVYDAVKAAESNQPSEAANIATPAEHTPNTQPGQSEPATGQRDKVAASGPESEGGSNGGSPANAVNRSGAEPPRTASTGYPRDDKFIDKAGNVRLDNINTSDDLKQVMHDAAARNSDFEDARRGVVSDGKVLDLAEAFGVDPAFIDKRKVGEAFNAEQIKYVEKTLAQSTQAVREAMQKFNDSPKTEADAAAYQAVLAKHDMIQETFSAITAEGGRAFRALKKTQSFWNQGNIELNQFLKNRQAEGKTLNQLIQEADFGAKLNTPAQLARFVQNSKSVGFKDMMLEYYINCLISGPITHFRYSVGNALNAVWTPLVETPIAAAIGAMKKSPDRVYFGEAGAQMHGFLKGSKDGLQAAIKAFKTGVSPALPGEKVSPMFMNKTNAIPGKLGTAINIPSKSVSAIHSFFKSIRYEQNIQALAYRQAMKEGLAGDPFTNRVANLTTSPTPEMMQSATANALKELYMSPTEFHSAMGSLTRFTNQSTVAKIIVPFMKIGSQITRNAFVERTPIGLASSKIRGTFAEGGAGADMQAAKMTAGMALMGTTALLAAEGSLTGDGPPDPQKRAVWLLSHQPNSIRIGSITIPYQGLGHLGMLMRFSANMFETARGWDQNGGDNLAQSFFYGINKSILDENFMRGLHDTLDAVYDKDKRAHYLENFATNWLPYSVGMSQMARKIDPYHRATKDIIDTAWSKIPVLSESLMPQRDIFGVPIPNSGPIQSYATDPVVQRMNALQMGVGKLEQKINGVQLTPQQYDDYSRIAGKMSKTMLNNLIQPGFETMPQGEQIKMIHTTIDHAREVARNMIKFNPANGDIIKQMIDNKKALLK